MPGQGRQVAFGGRPYPFLALVLVCLLGRPAVAQEKVQEIVEPVIEAVMDHGRCAAGLPLPGEDRCEAWTVRRPGTTTAYEMAVAVSPVDGTVFTIGVTAGQIEHIEDMDVAGETTAHDPETGEVLWTAATESDVGYAVPEALAVAPDGSRVFVAGWEYRGGNQNQNNYLVQALDASTGLLVWDARYDGPARERDWARAVTVSGSRVIVTGQSGAADGWGDVLTIAYDGATGARLWSSRFDGGADHHDAAAAITASPDGSLVIVTGQRGIANLASDFITIAYDTTTGEEAWRATFQSPTPGYYDGTRAIVASGDAVFVAGQVMDGATLNGYEWATVSYDIETGQQLWSSRYAIGLGGISVPRGIAITPDGARVFVTGIGDDGTLNGYGAKGRDYKTVAYDAETGSQLWVAHYDGPARARDEAHAVAVTPDGASVIVTGQSDAGPLETEPNGPSWDFVTIAYDVVSGEQRWLARYNASPSERDAAHDLAVSPSGDAVYVTGSGLGPARGAYGGEVHFQTVAYDL